MTDHLVIDHYKNQPLKAPSSRPTFIRMAHVKTSSWLKCKGNFLKKVEVSPKRFMPPRSKTKTEAFCVFQSPPPYAGYPQDCRQPEEYPMIFWTWNLSRKIQSMVDRALNNLRSLSHQPWFCGPLRAHIHQLSYESPTKTTSKELTSPEFYHLPRFLLMFLLHYWWFYPSTPCRRRVVCWIRDIISSEELVPIPPAPTSES